MYVEKSFLSNLMHAPHDCKHRQNMLKLWYCSLLLSNQLAKCLSLLYWQRWGLDIIKKARIIQIHVTTLEQSMQKVKFKHHL